VTRPHLGPPELPQPLVLEWDEAKAVANLAKHGLSFDLARPVLTTPGARLVPDEVHSVGEARWRCYGHVDLVRGPRLLVVVFTVRWPRVRIISLRKCNPREVSADAQERRGSSS
jgi:uncharacterized DUF497 family protein